MPNAVHGAFIRASPVVERPRGAGPVAAGNGLTLDTSKDLFVGASVVAELNKLYGGAFATRYATSGNIDTWTAFAVIGVRLPF